VASLSWACGPLWLRFLFAFLIFNFLQTKPLFLFSTLLSYPRKFHHSKTHRILPGSNLHLNSQALCTIVI
jgi:hypothetical protein